MSVLGASRAADIEDFIEGSTSAFKSDLIDAPHPACFLVDELKGVGAADQIVIGEGEELGSGGLVASGIEVIDELAVEEHLDLSGAIDIEGVEVEVDVL